MRACATALIRAAAAAAEAAESSIKDHQRTARRSALSPRQDWSKAGLPALPGGVGALLEGISKGFIDDVPEKKDRQKEKTRRKTE